MRFIWLSKASLLLLGVAATPLDNYVVKETHFLPDTFIRTGDAPKGDFLRLSVGLKQSRFDELERHLYEVSDPDHARYGQHLTQAEVNELIQPSDTALKLVHDWLKHHVNLDSIEYTPAKDFLSFTVSVRQAEKLLNTKYSVFRHIEGSNLIRTLEWSLPQELHEHVIAVQPTTAFLRPAPPGNVLISAPKLETAELDVREEESLASRAPSECDEFNVSLQCLRTLYKTINYQPKAADKNQISLTEWRGQLVNRSDARVYLERSRPEAVDAADSFQLISVNGGTVSQAPDTPKQYNAGNGIEGAIDLQSILGFTFPTNVTVYSVGGKPPVVRGPLEPKNDNEPYLTWLHYILKQPSIPQVVSTSYLDPETSVPLSYAHAVCSHFAQLGARGTTAFFSSGDGGVGPTGSCNATGTKQFIAGFPASCPYVTAVGATHKFDRQVVVDDPRKDLFVSGGGFSNVFPQPAYQKEAVAAYMKILGDKYDGYYNKSGRAYPDLAAYGTNVDIVYNGSISNLGGGTSQSCPIAASIFSLLNDALISHGQPPMGFLNPWLYKKGKVAFEDVTKGSTKGCGTKGFPATKGWDAASGWGAPMFDRLLDAVGLSSNDLLK